MTDQARRFSKLVKNSSWFFLVDVVSRGVALALIPLYTARISPADYGIVAICLTVSQIIMSFHGFGLFNFADRLLYRFHGQKQSLGVLLGTIYAFAFSLILLTSVLLTLFPGLIRETFFDGSQLPAAVILFVPIWIAFFKTSCEALRSYQLINQLGRQCFAFSVARNLSLHALKVVALVVFRLGLVGFLMAELITDAAIAIISLLTLFRMVKPRVRFRRLRLLRIGFRYGLPYIPNNLSSWLINFVDRIVILKLVGMWEVGLYSFGLAFVMSLFSLLWNPIRSGVAPEFPRQLDAPSRYPHASRNLSEFLYASVFFFSAIVLGFGLFGKEVLQMLANPRYHAAYTLFPFFALALLFQNAREIVQFPIMIKNRTAFFPINTAVGAAVNVAGNIVLIPIWGTVGAALSRVLANLVLLLLALFYAQRLIFIRYNYAVACMPVLVSFGLALTAAWIPGTLLTSIMYKVGILGCCLILFRYYLARHCPRILRNFFVFARLVRAEH